MNNNMLMADSHSRDTIRGVSKVDRYKWQVQDKKGAFRYITKGQLQFDHEHYQRIDINDGKVAEIRANWSWIGCGAISVAERDGRYFVMDGQYRTLAALGRSDISDLPCMVFQVADVKAEAAGFLALNTQRKPITSRDKFKALITTEDPDAAFVQQLLADSARGISNSNNRSARCLSNLLKWARIRRDVLRRMWPVMNEVCGDHSVHVHIVEGLMHLEMQMCEGVSLSMPRWRRRLIEVGFDNLLEASHKAVGFHGKGGGKVFAAGIFHRVNLGLKNKLRRKDEDKPE